MSDPTDPATHLRHLAGDHTRCRPGWCLAARQDYGQPEPGSFLTQGETTPAGSDQPSASIEAQGLSSPRRATADAAQAFGSDPAPVPETEPAEPRCAVCDVSIVWTKHPDRDQAGWLHATDPGEPIHGAYPAGGVS